MAGCALSELGSARVPIDDNEWLLPDEVARIVRTSERTLRRWRAEGTGPPFAKLGRVIRYRRVSLEAWLRAKERKDGD